MRVSTGIPQYLTPRWALILALGVGAASIGASGRAQGTADKEGGSVTGVVERLTTAPRGEVDGAVLDSGTLVHWPPHVGEHVVAIIGKGDRIRAEGGMETAPDGDRHFEAQTVTNVATKAVVNVAEIGPPAPPRRGGPRGGDNRPAGAAKTVRGTIERLTTAPRGEVDGAVLSDGSVIHWPPHLENRFASLAEEGAEVRASGRMETGPAGDTHLEVQTLTSLRTNDSATSDDAPPPRGPRRAGKDRDGDLDQRIRALQSQLDQVQRDLDRLRRER